MPKSNNQKKAEAAAAGRPPKKTKQQENAGKSKTQVNDLMFWFEKKPIFKKQKNEIIEYFDFTPMLGRWWLIIVFRHLKFFQNLYNISWNHNIIIYLGLEFPAFSCCLDFLGGLSTVSASTFIFRSLDLGIVI